MSLHMSLQNQKHWNGDPRVVLTSIHGIKWSVKNRSERTSCLYKQPKCCPDVPCLSYPKEICSRQPSMAKYSLFKVIYTNRGEDSSMYCLSCHLEWKCQLIYLYFFVFVWVWSQWNEQYHIPSGFPQPSGMWLFSIILNSVLMERNRCRSNHLSVSKGEEGKVKTRRQE